MEVSRISTCDSYPVPQATKTTRPWSALILAGLASAILGRSLTYFLHPTTGIPYYDFDVFHLIGKLTLDGKLALAYNHKTLFPIEIKDTLGTKNPGLPWTYPPQFDMLVAPLALIPKWLGYLLFEGGSLLALLVILKSLSGDRFSKTLLITSPLFMTSIFLGQNALLTASLVGCFVLLSLKRSRWAGLPLGLMIIKPHLAIGLGLYTVAKRNWAVAGVATGVILATSGLAALLFGPHIWPTFIAGLSTTSEAAMSGVFNPFVSISAFSALHGLHVPIDIAMASQVLEAMTATWLIFYAAYHRLGRHVELGAAVVATLCFSPYAFCYDLAILSVGVALLWPFLTENTSKLRANVFISMVSIAGAWELVLSELPFTQADITPFGLPAIQPAGAAYAFLVLLGMTAGLMLKLRRERLARNGGTKL